MLSTRTRHLENAPIKEALIDIKVELPDSVTLEALERAADSAVEIYPKKKRNRRVELVFDTTEEAASSEAEDRGFTLWTQDERQAVQFRFDGFTLNRLSPYDEWDPFCAEALRWWRVYESKLSPAKITRVGTRFINRFVLPDQNFGEYLYRPPLPPLGIKNGTLSSFSYRVKMETENGITAIITQLVEPPEGSTFPLIFDIDVFRKVGTGIEEDLPEVLSKLHEIKNNIFFEGVTDNALKLC
jgi:uncharacterized protein (TIGR04255 family)